MSPSARDRLSEDEVHDVEEVSATSARLPLLVGAPGPRLDRGP
jgi:hypothetical protein